MYRVDTELRTFDFNKHYNELAIKYQKFLDDFSLNEFVNFKLETGQNNCQRCHFQIDEPIPHQQAKLKLFNIMVKSPDHLVETELVATKNNGHLQVFDKGEKNYQFDVLCIHVKNLKTLLNHVSKQNPVTIEFLKKIEHEMIFALEADGDHSWKRDALRDKFFFEEYGIITARYEVSDLVDMYRKARSKYPSSAHMRYYQKEVTQAYHNNLSMDDIIGDVKAKYYQRYKLIPEKNYRSRSNT